MVYRFGIYCLDSERRELWRGSILVELSPQVFDVLECLVRNHERIVSKDDLLREVWDGRLVSESTISSRLTATRDAIGDNGKDQFLIRTVSRRGYRFIGQVTFESRVGSGDAQSNRRHPAHDTAAERARRPAIAILPFQKAPRRAATEAFVDGLVEDITTALSGYPWLSVVARSSSFAHQGWALDINDLERSLDVGYVLEGSVRVAQNRLRVTARLVDTRNCVHLWTSRFDVWQDDVFALQDLITARVVSEIGSYLERREINRAGQSENPDPLQCYLRGLGSLYSWTQEGITAALEQFNEAIRLDPEFAAPYGMAAYCCVQRKSYGWIADRGKENAECARLVSHVSESADADALTLTKAAHATASVLNDVEGGAYFVDRALRRNPNLSGPWYVSGWIRLFLGDHRKAVECLIRALVLGPSDPLTFKTHAALAYAYFFLGNYDQASQLATKALRARPKYLTAMRGAAASHALAGRLDNARQLIEVMHQQDRALSVSNLSELIPFHQSRDLNKWSDALALAGLPD